MISMRLLPLLVAFIFAFCVLQGLKQRAYREGKRYSSFQNLSFNFHSHEKLLFGCQTNLFSHYETRITNVLKKKSSSIFPRNQNWKNDSL